MMETPEYLNMCETGVARHRAWTLKVPPVCNGTLQLWCWMFSAVQDFETIKCQHQGFVSGSSAACCAAASIQQSYREISIKAELQRDHRPVLLGYFNRDQRNSGKLVTDEEADDESIKTLDLHWRKKICTEGYAVVWHHLDLLECSCYSNITVGWVCERLWDTELSHTGIVCFPPGCRQMLRKLLAFSFIVFLFLLPHFWFIICFVFIWFYFIYI